MADQENHGRWYNIVDKLFKRGLLGDLLSSPGNIVSQILSSPATTTPNDVQPAVTQAAASTPAAASPAPAATTPAAAAPVVATQAPPAQQPAATSAPSPKQEQPQPQQTPSPAVQAPPATTEQPAQKPPAATNAAVFTALNLGGNSDVLTTSPPAAAETVPPTAEDAASSQTSLKSSSTSKTGAASFEGVVTTRPGVTGPPQPSQTPISESTSNANNQGPLVATGVILGIVVFLGLSLLIFWCLRRKKRLIQRDHTAVPATSPVNGYAPDDRFRDHASQSYPEMSDTNSLVSGDMITHHHASPAQFALAHASSPGQDRETPGTVPFSSQPFSYAQAQQYVQSLADTGTFGFPPPPSIPSPSPIRIFRWPTRSSRSGASTPSAFTGRRSNKAASRHQSQHSRSTISSMLWHGRRDIIARSTMNRTPVLPKPSFASNNSPESPMQDSVHTPVLDWLHWIRGHQQVEPDPEMNHRKSFASTTDSAPSEISHARSASTASSGVFSHKVLSLQPPSTTPCETPEEGLHADADSFQYIPMPLFKRADSNAGGSSGSSGSVAPSGVSITQPR